MSASSTSSSTACSSQDENEPIGRGNQKESVEPPVAPIPDRSISSRQSEHTINFGEGKVPTGTTIYANSSMSTLDRSQYQSLPLSGIRRVTVQFGQMKIVVPWKEATNSTVRQLAEAALLRYKRARGINQQENGQNEPRIVRLECASDAGILDMDDVLEDVFDLNYDQIVAITDDQNPTNGSTSSVPPQKVTSSSSSYGRSSSSNGNGYSNHQQHHYAQPLPILRKPTTSAEMMSPVAGAYGSISINNSSSSMYAQPQSHKSRRDSVVEVRNYDDVISPGLRVSTATPENLTKMMMRSSLRDQKADEEGRVSKQARVTLSPEVEKKLAQKETSATKIHYEKNPGRLHRGSDRKSRINDAFMDARDRLAEKIDQHVNESQVDGAERKVSVGKMRKRGEAIADSQGNTIITFPYLEDGDEEEMNGSKSMGVEVNAVYDDPSSSSTSTSTTNTNAKLSAVQVMKIEKDGRIGRDGRIKVGDSIVEIDKRPVYQMSILRARAYINDLAVASKDVTLTIARSLESFLEQEAEENANTKPIFSALQQANTTQYIGHTTIVELVKSQQGFGFTVTGRETAKAERLFYIGTVKPYGVALGHLKSGDRLLEINGESTGNLTQSEIVDRLKQAMVGEKVKFLVSRVSQSTSVTPSTSFDNNKENENTRTQDETRTSEKTPGDDYDEMEKPARLSHLKRFDLIIPLNDTGSAGLGVSLKARVSVKSDGSRTDCGIFIKNVMHGGAAFKDGRLRVNDRIIGIEDDDLESVANSTASDTLTKKLKSIGPTMSHVRLSIVRDESRDANLTTTTTSSPAPSRMSSTSVLPSPVAAATTATHSRSASASTATSSSSASSSLARRVGERRKAAIAEQQAAAADDTDPFDREAPGRKSLSEKRGISGAADPTHIKLFQEIKHQRQNSAPPSSTARSEKRSKSQPRSMSQRNYQSRNSSKEMMTPEPPSAASLPRHHPVEDIGSGLLSRRSLSMESINRPMMGGAAQATHQQPPRGMQLSHPYPPGGAGAASPLMRLKNEESRERARDKSRRKSVGNVMKSFFGFGSKSRDVSPEKTTNPQLAAHQPPPHHEPILSGGGRVYVDYGDRDGYGMMMPNGYPHQNHLGSSSSGYDAEFYDRYAAHRYYQQQQQQHENDDTEGEYYQRGGGGGSSTSTYINYGLPTSSSYQRIQPPPAAATPGSPIIGGSYSLRRAYDYEDLEPLYQRIETRRPVGARGSGGSGGGDYYHMFNSWFAYTGGGGAGASAAMHQQRHYGSPAVRIAAASSIRGDDENTSIGSRRGRSASQEKYANDAAGRHHRKATTSASRMFIPRHGGGISAAAFSGGASAGSPVQSRRPATASAAATNHRLPQY